jgi:hypothetical protein
LRPPARAPCRELEVEKAENPGLRRSQLQELVWKKWQKSPENPMNQPNAKLGGSGSP